MITKFKIFENNSIWSQIDAGYEDDDHIILVDAWITDDDNEEGKIIASIDIMKEKVYYHDNRAKTDIYAQEVINDVLKNVVPKRKIEITAKKYNI